MRSVDKLAAEGIGINVVNFVIFDESGNFVVQTDTIEEAFVVADSEHVRIPAVVDLNGIWKEDHVFLILP